MANTDTQPLPHKPSLVQRVRQQLPAHLQSDVSVFDVTRAIAMTKKDGPGGDDDAVVRTAAQRLVSGRLTTATTTPTPTPPLRAKTTTARKVLPDKQKRCLEENRITRAGLEQHIKVLFPSARQQAVGAAVGFAVDACERQSRQEGTWNTRAQLAKRQRTASCRSTVLPASLAIETAVNAMLTCGGCIEETAGASNAAATVDTIERDTQTATTPGQVAWAVQWLQHVLHVPHDAAASALSKANNSLPVAASAVAATLSSEQLADLLPCCTVATSLLTPSELNDAAWAHGMTKCMDHWQRAQHMVTTRAVLAAAAAAAGEVVQCAVCFDERAVPDTVSCSNTGARHSVCVDCFRAYVATALHADGTAQRRCVEPGCTGVFSEAARAGLLTAREQEAFARCEAQAALAALGSSASDALHDTLHACRCGNATMVPAGYSVHVCAACGARTCIRCNQSDHSPLRCDEVLDAAAAATRRRVAVEEAMTAALVRICSCGSTFLKESGCNKMTCPRCGAYSCYICKQAIKGYDHFCDPMGANHLPGCQRCHVYDRAEPLDQHRVLDAVLAATADAGK